jgi:hypothetical protein
MHDTVPETIKKAFENDLEFTIKGYASSRGSVVDYVLKFAKKAANEVYVDLVTQSLPRLGDIKLGDIDVPEDLQPDAEALFKKAVGEQRASFEKTLNPPAENEKKKERVSKATPYEDTGDGYWKAEVDGKPVWVIDNLIIVNKVVREEPPVNSKPLTIMKRLVRERLPVDTLCHRLILKEGKYESVSIVNPVSIDEE